MKQGFSSEGDRGDRPEPDGVSGNGQPDAASSARTVLLIDDNPAVASAMAITLRMAGYRLEIAGSPQDGYSRLAAGRHDAVLLDLNFAPGRTGGEEGLACLARIMADDPRACVIVLTAHSGIRIAVAAMQAGARDFLMKPWRNAELVAKIEAAIRRGAPSTPAARPAGAQLLGDSAAMAAVRALVRRVGPTAAGVTVTGPAGSGRTLVAMAVQAASADAQGVPDRIDLRDAGAWDRIDAARGTLILRHPDRLDAVAQARLLDRLPPGLRCIAVADDVAALVPALRRRIATVEIPVPPLSARGEDALLLGRHFARVAAAAHGRPAARLTVAAEAAILAADWPDQVRGLALAIERAVLLSDDGTIDAAALAAPVRAEAVPAIAGGYDLGDTEKAVILAALRDHRHNVTQAATALGLSRGALYRRMARHGL